MNPQPIFRSLNPLSRAPRLSLTGKQQCLPNPIREVAWFACRTRARAEKQVDRLLERAGVETYLPLIERERQWADRKKRVLFPLLPGYIFARFPLERHSRVVKTPGLVMVLSEKGHPKPVREAELDAVRRFVRGIQETGEVPEPEPWWDPGIPMRVKTGPFQGMEGYLLENRGRRRVTVRLSALKLAFSVELDSGDLERAR